jgi:capsular polysaccharide biosynthesis protein
MQQSTDSRGVVFSQKLFQRLLTAYPKRHREEYGPAMAQLFRDQCRAAWHEARWWGLTTVWLRVLPDLVKTSVLEHLSTLNGRKSMFQKMIMGLRLRATPPATFRAVFAVVFLLVVITVAVVTFILPDSYASTARIKVEGDVGDTNLISESPAVRSNSLSLLQTEFGVIQSQAVLQKVIQNLDLNNKWAKRYNAEGKLTIGETVQLLKRKMDIRQFRNTSLIEIRVFSEEPKEAAAIANEIASVYGKHRLEAGRQSVLSAIATLEERLRVQKEIVSEVHGKVDRLRKELNIPSPEPAEEELLHAKYQPYWEAKHELEESNHSLRKLKLMVAADKVDLNIPNVMTSIVDSALPGMRPMKPNRPLNLTLGVVAGIFLASLAGGAAALIVFARRRGLQKNLLAT